MAIYNKGRESPRRPEEHTFKKESRPTRTMSFEENDFDVLLRTMKNKVDYDNLTRILRNAIRTQDIDSEEYQEYLDMANKKLSKINGKTQNKGPKSNDKTKQNIASTSISETISSDVEEKEDKEESNREKKVRGERNIDEESLRAKNEEKLSTKIGKFKAFAEFMQTPIARVLFFIIIGVFLLIYLTKNSMADVFGSPLVIVLVIVFMLLVLGKGGKTRHHNYDESENRY